jgi:hypothetical protein
MLKIFMSQSEHDKEYFPRRRGSTIRRDSVSSPAPLHILEKQPEQQPAPKEREPRKSIAQITTQLFPVDDHLYAGN